jgi:ribonuclease-3
LNECRSHKLVSNERLEFLGDAVLSLVVSEVLYNHFPNEEEGMLSKQKAHLVSQDGCAALMNQLDVLPYLLVGKGEQRSVDLKKPSISSDFFEALLGAIYLDGGWESARLFFFSHFEQYILQIAKNLPLNAKAELQEWLARKGKSLPTYQLKTTEGPAHDQLFTVSVLIDNVIVASGSGKTKREAEQKAAETALSILTTESK